MHCLKMIQTITFLITASIACGCVSSAPPQPEIGLREDYKAFIPAKIIVFPCQNWQVFDPPTAAKLGEASKKTCEEFDRFMLQSFSNQPYMNGFPPSTIKRIAETENDPKVLDWLSLWREASIATSKSNLIDYYVSSMSTQNKWLLWLARNSKLTQYTDGVLLPIIESIAEIKANLPDVEVVAISVVEAEIGPQQDIAVAVVVVYVSAPYLVPGLTSYGHLVGDIQLVTLGIFPYAATPILFHVMSALDMRVSLVVSACGALGVYVLALLWGGEHASNKLEFFTMARVLYGYVLLLAYGLCLALHKRRTE